MRRSQRWIWTLSAASVLLVGCSSPSASPNTEGDPTDGPPSSGPTASPTPTVTATTEPTSPGGPPDETGPQPVSALPLDCAQLASPSEVQAGFHQAVSLKVSETSAPSGAARADFLQAGGLYCAWRSSGSEGLQLGIISDAAANYAARVANLTGSGFRDDTVGDDSHVKCTIDGTSSRCAGDILVDDYWVAAITTDAGGAVTAAAAFSAFTVVLSPIVEEIASAAPPRGTWVSPTLVPGFDGGFLCESPVWPAAVLGSGTNGFTMKPTARDTATQGGLMSTRAGSTGCTWKLSDVTHLTFATLPGGAWAYERMADAGVGVPVESEFDGSLVVCGERCTAYTSYQGGLMTILMTPGLTADEAGFQIQQFALELGV